MVKFSERIRLCPPRSGRDGAGTLLVPGNCAIDADMQYYDSFKMQFTARSFTTDWQQLEVGVAAGCTISVILFVLVVEMI